VEGKLLFNSLLERLALFQGKRVSLGDDRYDIDDVGQLLQDNDIDGFEAVKDEQSALASNGFMKQPDWV
jgi:hypothetical protein